MAESNFVDYVKIYCRSGKGGREMCIRDREKSYYKLYTTIWEIDNDRYKKGRLTQAGLFYLY